MMNQHHGRTNESHSWHEKRYSAPSDVEQIHFYMSREDALTVSSGLALSFLSVRHPPTPSRKQAERREHRECGPI